jgi:hypothetical protein
VTQSPVPLIDHSIQLFQPAHGEEEVAAVAEVIRSGWWGQGPKTAEFEARFASPIDLRQTNRLLTLTRLAGRIDPKHREDPSDVVRAFSYA